MVGAASCLGVATFQNPKGYYYKYETMTEWGRACLWLPASWSMTSLSRRMKSTSTSTCASFCWAVLTTMIGKIPISSVKNDPLGNPVRAPSLERFDSSPQKRDFDGKYTWVMSPRWLDQRTGDHLALDTGGGPIARLWATALAGIVDIGYIKATGHSVKMYLPKTVSKPEVEFEWKIPKWSNAIERDRARTYFQAYAASAALYFAEKALQELHASRTKTWTEFKVPEEAMGSLP